MALIPRNKKHQNQILAGTIGRNKGHEFEERIVDKINRYSEKDLHSLAPVNLGEIIYRGDPSKLILRFLRTYLDKEIREVEAICLGTIATSKNVSSVTFNGQKIKASKSDIIIRFSSEHNFSKNIGVSIKTCNAKTPTNDQLFFTTASAFCNLLRENGLKVKKNSEIALKMFCGDTGFRPVDMDSVKNRKSDPERWFWEELPPINRKDLETLLDNKQNEITEILFKKAYLKDPFPPEFLMHQTKRFDNFCNVEIAIFSISQLVKLSRRYSRFDLRPYKIRKGRFKKDPHTHLAPRFGIVQMQRGGQKQHPTQLQFNLKAGYFYHLLKLI